MSMNLTRGTPLFVMNTTTRSLLINTHLPQTIQSTTSVLRYSSTSTNLAIKSAQSRTLLVFILLLIFSH